jgi:hypothetical protein
MTKEQYLSTAQKDFCDRFYEETGIDLAYMLENDEYTDIDTLMDDLREAVGEIEVIYYNNAMEYLSENDPSLQYSLGIAHDMGYTAENINSELLATLLKQQNAMEAVEGYADELEEVVIDATEE